MNIDLDRLARPGVNQPVFAPNGVVATSQPLAAQAGLDVLRAGGNALDAAISTVAVLTVVEPGSTCVGGDAFALIWDGNKLHGLNGSGRSPAALSRQVVMNAGHSRIPNHGWMAVTVPGAPAAWRDAHQRFGRLPFARVLQSAIDYAERGFPVAPISAWGWDWQAMQVHPKLTGAEFAGFSEVFAPGGSAPCVGETWRNADMANSLKSIAESYGESFYRGDIAERIVDFAKTTGGYITREDLEAHTSTWVDPITTRYRDHDVHEIPPNGQGLAALIALNILEGFDLGSHKLNSTESVHLQLEAMKLAFADAHRYIADPAKADVPTSGLLSKAYAADRRKLIGMTAMVAEPGIPPTSDTVYLCTADSDGMMVSFIQSSYEGFGSHIVVPGTGLPLQNRGMGFTLDPDHLNCLEPNKRPFHTIIPGFLTRDGAAIGPFGVMGGHMQPQGHVQMVVNTIDYGLEPQASLDNPRWSWWQDESVHLEPAIDAAVLAELQARGHRASMQPELANFGRGQIIWKLPNGGYIAGSDHRTDGQAAGY